MYRTRADTRNQNLLQTSVDHRSARGGAALLRALAARAIGALSGWAHLAAQMHGKQKRQDSHETARRTS